MQNETYLQEGIDLKRIIILLYHRLWLFLSAILAGAVIVGGGYLLKHLVIAPEKKIASVSKLYLDFDTEPEQLSQLSYNGYTWNDLLDTDPILDTAMEVLPDTFSREEVAAATKAEILSDIRLLTVTVTTTSAEQTGQIMDAIQKALVELGNKDKLFRSISVYGTTEPAKILWDNRTTAAILTGAVLGALAFAVAAAFFYVLDDAVYVTADVRRRYGIPAFGIEAKGEGKLTKELQEEIKANLSYRCSDKKRIAFVSTEPPAEVERTAKKIQTLAGERLVLSLKSLEHITPALFEQLREMDGILLSLPFGRRNGRLAAHMLGLLKEQDCEVIGIVITGASERFLKRYYFFGQSKKTKDGERL